jgi:geranylgeranyl diphosphate synthase type II
MTTLTAKTAARMGPAQARKLETLHREIEQALELGLLPSKAAGEVALLDQAMRYSLVAPAKRVRAILTLLAAEGFGAPTARALSAATAIEMVHAASLVLDDLPAMDNAALRRGRATNHRVYGEDRAILVAIGLLNRAYGVIAADTMLDPLCRLDLTRELAQTIGLDGLIGGQVMDLHPPGVDATHADVDLIHSGKTGVLFAAAAYAGARVANATADQTHRMRTFGLRLGMAFQAFDDLLDVHGSEASAGKDVGHDRIKCTHIVLSGTADAERRANAHIATALDALSLSGIASDDLELFVTELVRGFAGRFFTPGTA